MLKVKGPSLEPIQTVMGRKRISSHPVTYQIIREGGRRIIVMPLRLGASHETMKDKWSAA